MTNPTTTIVLFDTKAQFQIEPWRVFAERKSADGFTEYTIYGNPESGWDVDCWGPDGSNHWNRWFRLNDAEKAFAEYNRFP